MATDLLKRCKAVSKEQRALFAYYYVVILIFRRYEICEYERNIEYQHNVRIGKTLRFLTNLRVKVVSTNSLRMRRFWGPILCSSHEQKSSPPIFTKRRSRGFWYRPTIVKFGE